MRWDSRGVSRNSAGRETPTQDHTMSGDWPLFHAVASARTRSVSEAEERSALMAWNRWVEGDLAEACSCVRYWSWKQYKKVEVQICMRWRRRASSDRELRL